MTEQVSGFGRINDLEFAKFLDRNNVIPLACEIPSLASPIDRLEMKVNTSKDLQKVHDQEFETSARMPYANSQMDGWAVNSGETSAK